MTDVKPLMTQPQVRAAVAEQVGEPLPDGTFRQWKSRGQIVPAGQDAEGKVLYDLNDALRLMHRRMRRKAPKPPAPSKPRRGEGCALWRGDTVGYHAVHYRLRRMIGRPNECNLDDYVRMCKPCHKQQMDIRHARDVEFRRGS